MYGSTPPPGGCHPSLYSAFPLEVYLVAPFLLFFPQWRLGQDRYVVGSLCRRVWPSQTFWALSIQFMFRFEISEIPCAQWNGTFWLHRPNPSHCVFGYCSCKEDTKEWYWGQQVCQMERDISVRPTDRDNQTSQSGSPSKLVPNISVGPNWNGPFHLMYQPKFLEFWVEWKAPCASCW